MAIAACFGQVSASALSRAIASSVRRQLELEGKKKVADCGVVTVDLGERSSDGIDLECGDVIEIKNGGNSEAPDESALSSLTGSSLESVVASSSVSMLGMKSHYQKKLEKARSMMLKRVSGSPEKAQKTEYRLRTRSTSLQKNIEWRNKQSSKKCVDERYKHAFKLATKDVAAVRSGKLTNITYQDIVDKYNKQFNLDGHGRENSREKRKLNVSTLAKSVDKGMIGCSPKKKGRKEKIDRDFVRLVALHANMEQVGVSGEKNSADLKAIVEASILGTEHEGTFNVNYFWETVQCAHANIMVPQCTIVSKDIRWQWVTHENLDLWLLDMKRVYVEYGFALDEPQNLTDGTVSKITYIKSLKSRNMCFDETEIEICDKREKSGP